MDQRDSPNRSSEENSALEPSPATAVPNENAIIGSSNVPSLTPSFPPSSQPNIPMVEDSSVVDSVLQSDVCAVSYCSELD